MKTNLESGTYGTTEITFEIYETDIFIASLTLSAESQKSSARNVIIANAAIFLHATCVKLTEKTIGLMNSPQ